MWINIPYNSNISGGLMDKLALVIVIIYYFIWSFLAQSSILEKQSPLTQLTVLLLGIAFLLVSLHLIFIIFNSISGYKKYAIISEDMPEEKIEDLKDYDEQIKFREYELTNITDDYRIEIDFYIAIIAGALVFSLGLVYGLLATNQLGWSFLFPNAIVYAVVIFGIMFYCIMVLKGIYQDMDKKRHAKMMEIKELMKKMKRSKNKI